MDVREIPRWLWFQQIEEQGKTVAHFLSNKSSLNQIWNKIKGMVDTNDYVLIIAVGTDNSGQLPKAAWDLINVRLKNAA